MSVEVLYLLKDEPGVGLRELDDVVLLHDAETLDGEIMKAGAEGTIVIARPDSEVFVVEFSSPEGALASVLGRSLGLVGRHADA